MFHHHHQNNNKIRHSRRMDKFIRNLFLISGLTLKIKKQEKR